MIQFSKIEHDLRKLLPKLKQYFGSSPEVDFAYLFGSYGERRETPLSDVDIAVFLLDNIPRAKYFDLRLKMMSDVSHLLRTDEIDLIILNEGNICLAYHAVSTREVLFERDPNSRIEFETRTLDRYLDMKPFRQVQQQYFLRQVREGLIFG